MMSLAATSPFQVMLNFLLQPQFIALFILFIVVVILGGIFKSSFFKGWFGEFVVRQQIKFLLNREVYRAIHNVTLPAEGGSTQIDHVLVSPFGLFCLETKNMGGAIYGDDKQSQWKQAFGKAVKNNFQNPLRQNYKHCKTLASILDLDDEKIKPVIIFNGAAKFPKGKPEGVYSGGTFIDHIKSFKEETFSSEEIDSICARIEEIRFAPGIRTHLEHVENVKKIIEEKEAKKAARNQNL